MTPFRLATALALVALAGCSGPLVGADIDEPRLCLVLPTQTIPGAVVPAGTVLPATSTDITLDLGSRIPGLDKSGAVTGALHVLSLNITGTTDLTSITAGDVAVIDAAGPPGTVFMHYAEPAPVPDPTAIDMTLDQDLNLLSELQSGQVTFRITLTGQPPPTSWTASVETCLSAHLTIDALKAL